MLKDPKDSLFGLRYVHNEDLSEITARTFFFALSRLGIVNPLWKPAHQDNYNGTPQPLRAEPCQNLYYGLGESNSK